MNCRDCGEAYDPRDETSINGQALGLCVPCAEDHLHPSVNFEGWDE